MPDSSGALLVLCDMDGVLYRGHAPIDGAAAAISSIQAGGHRVCYATNNGWSPIATLVGRLRGMGIAAREDDVVGSSWMAAELYRQTASGASRPYVVGGSELRYQLRRVGARPAPPTRPDLADSVVLGLDLAFSYRRLARAQVVALRGGAFIATDADASYPWHDGQLPGTGAILRAVEVASGRRALVAGKPEPHMYAELMRRHGARSAVVVGDNLDTDIAAGKRIGAVTVLALTGLGTEEDAARRPPESRPDYVIPSIRELPALLARLAQ